MQNMKTDKKIIKKDTKIRENFKRDIIGQVLLDQREKVNTQKPSVKKQ